jgi:DNA replication protein DnaD
LSSKVKMEVPYFQVPNAIYEMKDLDLYEKSVYIYLCRCGNHGGKAFPSYQTIADKTGMSRYKAIQTIDSLIQKEYIKKKARSKSGERQTNIYYVDTLVNRVDYLVNDVDPYKEPVIKKNNRRKVKRPELTHSDMEVLLKTPGFM